MADLPKIDQFANLSIKRAFKLINYWSVYMKRLNPNFALSSILDLLNNVQFKLLTSKKNILSMWEKTETPNAKVKFQIKCLKCGTVLERTRNHILTNYNRGRSNCKKCSQPQNKLSRQDFFAKLKNFEIKAQTIFLDKEQAWSDYMAYMGRHPNAQVHFKCRCQVCGEYFETTLAKMNQLLKRNSLIFFGHSKCANKASNNYASSHKKWTVKQLDDKLNKRGLIRVSPYEDYKNRESQIIAHVKGYPNIKRTVIVSSLSSNRYRGLGASNFENLILVVISHIWPNESFQSCWPKWMRDSSGSKRELDIFNHRLKLGIEVDGYHHDNPAVKKIDIEKDELFFKAMGQPLIRFDHKEFFYGVLNLNDDKKMIDYFRKVYNHLLKNMPNFLETNPMPIDKFLDNLKQVDLSAVVYSLNHKSKVVKDNILKKGWVLLDMAYGIEIGKPKKKSIYYLVGIPDKKIKIWQTGDKINSGEFKGLRNGFTKSRNKLEEEFIE
ncbi:MAG: endonuclease domain-containing protein [Cyclobacteriaceae bacterium]|nr:endonuclease domain-containing protein [Cyclobacteriaceae bacterium]